MSIDTPPPRSQDLAGLARRLIAAARSGSLVEDALAEAEARIAIVEGPHFDTLGLRPSECRRFVVERLAGLRRVARQLGYAIAVHGSGARDVDLLAVPWVVDAADRGALVVALTAAMGPVSMCEGEQATAQPHGRLSWSIWLHDYSTYVDLSVLPRIETGP